MVVISTQRLQKILPIKDAGDAKQVLCFAGAGIFSVQETLNLGAGPGAILYSYDS